MERTSLIEFLDRGWSLEQIGRAVGRHPSTVAYWMHKHGLEAVGRERHAARGGVAREALAALVERGLSSHGIARELGLSQTTVRHWLKRHGLRTEKARSRAAKRAAQGRVVRTCQTHGKTEFVLGLDGYFRCRRCRALAVSRQRRRAKAAVVREAGGKCQICGYDRYVGALEFHHRVPEEKAFGLAERGISRSVAKMREEARKCVLLCGNCHAEVEAGIVPLPLAEPARPGPQSPM